MKALLYSQYQGLITVAQVDDPAPKNHGVVVKVTASGLCRSDWHGWMGHDPDIVLPHVPGHELAGIVVAVGKDVKQFNEGDRVTVPFVCGCGTCRECVSGNQQVCDFQTQPGFTHWGSFAEFVALDYADTNLVKLPSTISDETAAILGCRFITAYRAVVAQGQVAGGQFVAVHGCGGVGLSAIMIARALGAQTIAIDINPETLALATKVGATYTINAAGHNDVVAEVKALTQGGAHVSIDALGSPTTCFNSIANLRKRGKHIQVGLMTGDHRHPSIPMDRVLSDELEVIGSHGMQAYKYPEMLAMVANQQLAPEQLISHPISLAEAAQALPNMDKFENTGVLVINSF